MEAFALTDVGIERKINQDYVYFTLKQTGHLPNLFIVADGMGGHKAGDVASRYTVDEFVSLIENATEKDDITVISEAVTKVNTMLLEKAKESPDYTGMGTTLVVATIKDEMLRVANVGDSRLYVIGTDGIRQITRDHSLVEEMVSMGEIDRKEARTHKRKNIITRAIGGDSYVEPEMFCVELMPDDIIMMCSDGLTNMIEDEDIFKIVKQNLPLDKTAETLVDTANSNGGKDNISVILIKT